VTGVVVCLFQTGLLDKLKTGIYSKNTLKIHHLNPLDFLPVWARQTRCVAGKAHPMLSTDIAILSKRPGHYLTIERYRANIIATMSIKRQRDAPMKLNEFLSRYAVFTVDELNCVLSARGSGKSNTRKSLLTYYRNQGRIIPIRRGLYATVPLGGDPIANPVDPYLVAAKMSGDAVLAYHTAMEFHGKAYSVYTRLHYVSKRKSLPLRFQSHEFRRVPVPHLLQEKRKELFGVTSHKWSGVELRVTNFERTFVDMLDRPNLAGSWEEIWRSLESVEFFDLDQVVEYVLLLENATTAAKVGFFLEQHQETLMVDATHLNQLRSLCPRQPHYFDRGKRKGCQWVKNWNLLIPLEILNRSWGEVL
jgi:predicted transcriptional regulator of viral defense system